LVAQAGKVGAEHAAHEDAGRVDPCHLLHVALHRLLLAKDVAHRTVERVGLLPVSCERAVISSVRVVRADRRPAA